LQLRRLEVSRVLVGVIAAKQARGIFAESLGLFRLIALAVQALHLGRRFGTSGKAFRFLVESESRSARPDSKLH
jgi:hypothetical protein